MSESYQNMMVSGYDRPKNPNRHSRTNPGRCRVVSKLEEFQRLARRKQERKNLEPRTDADGRGQGNEDQQEGLL
jgi:hypothetical protein